jgi:hypothetical protein
MVLSSRIPVLRKFSFKNMQKISFGEGQNFQHSLAPDQNFQTTHENSRHTEDLRRQEAMAKEIDRGRKVTGRG